MNEKNGTGRKRKPAMDRKAVAELLFSKGTCEVWSLTHGRVVQTFICQPDDKGEPMTRLVGTLIKGNAKRSIP
ncbi:MAG: hypothetical protein HGA31_04180 [Candidatus Moranbacteria bacterium]|nr:hypothetical protein [Candidatus Moranbacteria bacterium]